MAPHFQWHGEKVDKMALTHLKAIVTGAAGGIGQVLVKELLAEGATVLAVDMDGDRLSSLAQQISPEVRHRFHSYQCDLCEEDCGRRLYEASILGFGGANALISNAGVGRSIYTNDLLDSPPPVWEVPTWAWERMFRINTLGSIHLINAIVPYLLERGWGRIVTVTTSLDHMLKEGTGAYGPSKAALEAFTSALARELLGTGVTANVLVPGGPVDTPMMLDASGMSRKDLLPADVMVPPLKWLLSTSANEITCRRIRANLWETSHDPLQAFEASSAPAGWWGVAAGQQRTAPRS